MSRRVIATLPVIVVLAACGAFVPIQSPVSDAATALPVLAGDAAKGMTDLGEVVGYSCKYTISDPAATPEAATFQVKLAAIQRGATAITTPSCTEGGFSVGPNCWQSYSCRATALRQ